MDCPDFTECYGPRHEDHAGHYKILYACSNFQQVKDFLTTLDEKMSATLEWQIWREGDKEPFKIGQIRKQEVKTYTYQIQDNPQLEAIDIDRNSHRPWEDR